MVFIDNQEKETVYDKAIRNRIARTTGHLKSVKTMVEIGRDCAEVLIQLAAVKAEITNTSKEILKKHVENSIEQSVDQKKPDKIREISQVLDRYFQ